MSPNITENIHGCRVGFAIKTTSTMMQNSFNAFLKPYDIAGEQFTLLRLAEKNPEISQKEMGDYLLKNKTTITKMLDVLEKKGFILRERHGNDRRSFRIAVTDKGKKLIKEVTLSFDPIMQRFNEQFTEEELHAFEKVIAKCQEFIRKEVP